MPSLLMCTFIHLYSSYEDEDSFGANPCLNAMLPLVSHIISKHRHQVFIDIFRQQGIGINFLRKTMTRFPFCKGSKSSLPQPGRSSLAKGICRNPSLAVLHIKAFVNSSDFQISSTHQRCTPRFSHVMFIMFSPQAPVPETAGTLHYRVVPADSAAAHRCRGFPAAPSPPGSRSSRRRPETLLPRQRLASCYACRVHVAVMPGFFLDDSPYT